MSNKSRWTSEEELNLVKDISTGISIEILAQKHNRPITAIELRLKKIIYGNVSSGKTIQQISKLLNLPEDKITQHYYSYKDYKEKYENIIDTHKQSAKPIDLQHGQSGGNITKEHNNIPKEQGFFNDRKLDKIDTKLKKIELENKILRLIVENKDLTHKLNRLIKDGKVDKSIKNLIKVVRNTT